MLSEKMSIRLLKYLLLPVLVGVFSIAVCAKTVPNSKFVQSTLESIEDSKMTVMEFEGATLAASVAITLLPDDTATPIADNFAKMSKYFIAILMVLFVEKLLMTVGIKMSLLYVIPVSCGLFILGNIFGKKLVVTLSKKIFILGIAIILVVPCSVKFTNYAGADYLAYVNETIEDTNGEAYKITDEMADDTEEKTVFEKLSTAFKTAINGVSDMIAYFNNMVKKCVNSIAILIITNFIMPVATLFLFQWILKELFGIIIPTTQIQSWIKMGKLKEGSNELLEEKE